MITITVRVEDQHTRKIETVTITARSELQARELIIESDVKIVSETIMPAS